MTLWSDLTMLPDAVWYCFQQVNAANIKDPWEIWPQSAKLLGKKSRKNTFLFLVEILLNFHSLCIPIPPSKLGAHFSLILPSLFEIVETSSLKKKSQNPWPHPSRILGATAEQWRGLQAAREPLDLPALYTAKSGLRGGVCDAWGIVETRFAGDPHSIATFRIGGNLPHDPQKKEVLRGTKFQLIITEVNFRGRRNIPAVLVWRSSPHFLVNLPSIGQFEIVSKNSTANWVCWSETKKAGITNPVTLLLVHSAGWPQGLLDIPPDPWFPHGSVHNFPRADQLRDLFGGSFAKGAKPS